MAIPVATFTQYLAEKKRYQLDYSCFLPAGEFLSGLPTVTVTTTTSPPLAVSGITAYGAGDGVLFFLAGGVVGTTYNVSVLALTTAGQIKQTDFKLRVL